jgi:hypothetical protein
MELKFRGKLHNATLSARSLTRDCVCVRERERERFNVYGKSMQIGRSSCINKNVKVT